jgi:NAD(P)-dependent dehydrogenase (short-subunit alcohol dehydrogenase family)
MPGMESFSLADTTVVVLGGSSGIGLATAQMAQAAGAKVVITGRSPERLASAMAQLGGLTGGAESVALDSVDEAGTEALFERLGPIDHVFVSAGSSSGGSLSGRDTEAIRPDMDTRLWGSVYAAKYGSSQMRAGGSITFCSGVSGRMPRPGGSAVSSASCAAVEALGRSLAIELAPIRVNTVVPGFILTPLLDGAFGDQQEERLAAVARSLPVHRVGQAEDIGHAVLFLMTNGFTTGISLVIDGGRVLI